MPKDIEDTLRILRSVELVLMIRRRLIIFLEDVQWHNKSG
ncbi:hypothetical protein LINPERHAP1_LOCUS40096 [Linum perenne]